MHEKDVQTPPKQSAHLFCPNPSPVKTPEIAYSFSSFQHKHTEDIAVPSGKEAQPFPPVSQTCHWPDNRGRSD